MSQPSITEAKSLSATLLRLRIEHLWLSLPLLLVTWMGFIHPLRTLDFWWHLKVGEVIVTSGSIPRVDLFSFTRAGQPFVYQNWLGEVFYYLIYRAGGFPWLIGFNTLLLLLAFIPILHLCVEAVHGRRLAALYALVAALTLGWYSNVRPQVYSFVLFAFFYHIVWGYREGRRDRLWMLPVLMALWVNLHGAFVLGIGMLGLVWGTETARRVLLGPRADTLAPSALAKLGLVLALTVLACGLNPEGLRVFAYVRQLQVDPSSQLLVSEWQSPSIKEWSGIAVFFAAFFLSVLVFLYSHRRLDLTELGLFLAFAVLGLQSVRNGIWFGLTIAPMLARHAAALEIPSLREGIRQRLHLDWLARRVACRRQASHPTRYALNWAILLCLLGVTLLLSPWVRPHLKLQRLRPQLVEKGTPVGAMDYIAAHGLTGHIFHVQDYGDYLIWRLWPQQRSFIDGRVHLYDLPFVKEYILTFHDTHWESRLAKYDIQYLMLPKDDENAQSMIGDARRSQGWTLLYEDDISVLFEKQP